MPGEADKIPISIKDANELSDMSKMEEKGLHVENDSSKDTYEHLDFQVDALDAQMLDDAEHDNTAIHTAASAATIAESAFAHLSQNSSAATSDAVDNQNQAPALRKPDVSSQSLFQSNENKSLVPTPDISIGHDEHGQRRARIQGLPYQSPYATAPAQNRTSTQAESVDVGLIPNDTLYNRSVVPDVPRVSLLPSTPPRQLKIRPSRSRFQRESSRPAVSQDMFPPRVYRKLAPKLPLSALMQPVPSQPTPSQPTGPMPASSQLASLRHAPFRPVPSHLVPARVAPPPPPTTTEPRPPALTPLQPALPIADALPGLLTLASKPATAASSTPACSSFRPKLSPNPFSASSASTLPLLSLLPSYAQEEEPMRSTAFSAATGFKSSLSKSKKEAGQEDPCKTVRFSDPVPAALPFDRPRYSPYHPVNSVSAGRQAPRLRARDKKKDDDSGDDDEDDDDDDDDNDSRVSAASSTVKSTHTGLSGGGKKPLRKRRRTSMPPSMTASPGSTYDTPYAAILPPVSPDATAAVSPLAAEVQQVGAPSSPMSALSPTVSEQADSMSLSEAATSARFASIPIPPFTPESAAFTEMLFQGLGTAPLSGWDASASPYPAGYFAGTAPLSPPPLQHQQRQSLAPSAPAVDWVSAPPSHWGTVDPVFYRWVQPAGAQESGLDDGSSSAASRNSVDEWEAYDPQLWERANEQVDNSSMSLIEHWNSLLVGMEEDEQQVRASDTTMRRPAARCRSRPSQVVSSGVVRRPVSSVPPVPPVSPVPSSGQMSDEVPLLVSVHDFAVPAAPRDGQPTTVQQWSKSMPATEVAAQPAPSGSQVAPSALSGRDSSAASAASTAHHGNGQKRSHDISSSDSDSSSSSSSFWAPQLDGTQDHDTAATGGMASLSKKRRRRLHKQRKRQQRQKERQEQEQEQQQKQESDHDNAGDGAQLAHTSESCAVGFVDTQAGSALNTSGRQSHNMQAAAELNFADVPSRNTSNLTSMHPDRHALLSQSGRTDTSLGTMHPDHHALPSQSGNTDISLESMHPDRHALLSEVVEQVVEDADDFDDETWTMHPERYARLQQIEESEHARQASHIKIPTGLANPVNVLTGSAKSFKVPIGSAKPMKTPTGPANLVKMPTGPANPVKIPTGPAKPPKKPTRPAKSIKIPTGPANPGHRAPRA